MQRGVIYLYDRPGTHLGDGYKAKLSPEEVLIVSSNVQNAHNRYAMVVYLYRQTTRDLPTHVTVRRPNGKVTVACEHVRSINVDNIGAKVGEITKTEMSAVDVALAIALGLDFGAASAQKGDSDDTLLEAVAALEREAAALERENEALRQSLQQAADTAKIGASAQISIGDGGSDPLPVGDLTEADGPLVAAYLEQRNEIDRLTSELAQMDLMLLDEKKQREKEQEKAARRYAALQRDWAVSTAREEMATSHAEQLTRIIWWVATGGDKGGAKNG